MGWASPKYRETPHVTVKRKWFSLALTGVDWSNINRPIIRWDWADERQWWIGLEWGNGNSDPVWDVCLNVFLAGSHQ